MHDPMTVAFKIKSPIKRKSKLFKDGYRNSLVTIWHVDPEKDGTDDSCGWFMRSRHGDQEQLKLVEKRFKSEWDTVFKSDSGHVYHNGLFCPDGDPNLSVSGITLQLFFSAAIVAFGSYDKAVPFMRRHLFEILHFAENPVDSLSDTITRKYEIGCGEAHTPDRRKQRIHTMADTIYSWILRKQRPWYKHPRWHVWHWKIQIHGVQTMKRWLFSRCAGCGKRFQWGYSPVTTQWDNDGPRWFKSERKTYHEKCCP